MLTFAPFVADEIIEAMNHNVKGLALMTSSSLLGPKATTLLDGTPFRTRTSLHVFTDERAKNCKLVLPAGPMQYTTSGLPNKLSFRQHDASSPSDGNNHFKGSVRKAPSPILENAPSFKMSTQMKDPDTPERANFKTLPEEGNTCIVLSTCPGDADNTEEDLQQNYANTESSENGKTLVQLYDSLKDFKNETQQVVSSNSTQTLEATDRQENMDKLVPKSATPLTISSETQQMVNRKLKLGRHITSISPIPRTLGQPDDASSASGGLTSERTSLNDVTLCHYLDGAEGSVIQSRRTTSSPIPKKPATEPEVNHYKPSYKDKSPETDALYNMDVDLM